MSLGVCHEPAVEKDRCQAHRICVATAHGTRSDVAAARPRVSRADADDRSAPRGAGEHQHPRADSGLSSESREDRFTSRST
jgi:hypothetical protein